MIDQRVADSSTEAAVVKLVHLYHLMWLIVSPLMIHLLSVTFQRLNIKGGYIKPTLIMYILVHSRACKISGICYKRGDLSVWTYRVWQHHTSDNFWHLVIVRTMVKPEEGCRTDEWTAPSVYYYFTMSSWWTTWDGKVFRVQFDCWSVRVNTQ